MTKEEEPIWITTKTGGRLHIPFIQKMTKKELNKFKIEEQQNVQNRALKNYRDSDEFAYVNLMLKIRRQQNLEKQRQK